MFFGSIAVILASSCGFAEIFAAMGFNRVEPAADVVGAGDVAGCVVLVVGFAVAGLAVIGVTVVFAG